MPRMSFLKLSSYVINLSKVSHISIKEGLYHINITENNVSGFMLAGSGYVSNTEHNLSVCKDKNREDYDIVSKWIDNLNK